MCGLAGYFDLRGETRTDLDVLVRMADTIEHRGPDSCGYVSEGSMGFGFRRLSIIDPAGGDQPLYNEDKSIILVCNGEIFNYTELRDSLEAKGHILRTNSDVEVLPHLYEEYGTGLLDRLNGQFAFALYDAKKNCLLLARDHFGINPLYYTVVDGLLIFASEIKALLAHPKVVTEVDLTGLDQILTFPGLVSPRTMFKGIQSLKSGHYLIARNGDVSVREYWDLDYPGKDDIGYEKNESYYIEKVADLFARSVKYRLQSDVPVGFYLSGGMDSSMIAAMIQKISPDFQRHSFSISFTDKQICESKHQKLMSEYVDSEHHDIIFEWNEISRRLSDMIYHSECPVKETYNTCSMALSEAAKKAGITVILTGEGADELFAGYVGYRFDQYGLREPKGYELDEIMEEELRHRVWGDKDLFYETEFYAFREIKTALYSDRLSESFDDFDCLNFELVNKDRLRGRHPIHQRSYLDFKLRLSDHLISDHGDRMALANSVEARYPFLDRDLIEFSKIIPPDLKLNQFTEKYILKRVAEEMIPAEIINREKFGFHAPGSPYLLQQNIEWINDMLSYEHIKADGYFNPDVVERLKAQYSQKGFRLNLPFEIDLLTIVLTFSIFRDKFGLQRLN
ncbi:MAG: asparagine synthase (glutamine-hydrolyzing) [Blastocatellia bacterium]